MNSDESAKRRQGVQFVSDKSVLSVHMWWGCELWASCTFKCAVSQFFLQLCSVTVWHTVTLSQMRYRQEFDTLWSHEGEVQISSRFELNLRPVLPSVSLRYSFSPKSYEKKIFLIPWCSACCFVGVGFCSIWVFNEPRSRRHLMQLDGFYKQTKYRKKQTEFYNPENCMDIKIQN